MNPENPEMAQLEKRQYIRSKVQIWAKERVGRSTYYHLLTQLSENGFFIDKKLPFPLNAEVAIEMRMPHSNNLIHFKGIVVNNYQEPGSRKTGMGIKISEIDQDAKNEIKSYLQTLADE